MGLTCNMHQRFARICRDWHVATSTHWKPSSHMLTSSSMEYNCRGNNHCTIICIYDVFTADQMWCKCFSKYGICDINTVVSIKDSFTIVVKDSFTIVEMSHIYIHICTIFE